jgi:pimeloyl-ACP methyl ester carboxylesterase
MTALAPSGSALLAYDAEGDGPPVLLLHAGVTDRRAWRRLVDDLTPRHRTVAYDRRGYGETTYEAEPHDPVGDALAVLDHAGVDGPVAVVGASMGGRLAIDLTLDHPERVDRLVLIGSGCHGAPDRTPGEYPESYREIAHAIDLAEAAEDWDEVNALEAWLWLDGPSARDGRVGGAARELFLDMNGRALRAAPVGDPVDRPSAWDRLGEIAVPTLVLIGDLDLEDVADTAEGLAERIPGAELEWLEETAHLPHLERHPRCLRAIADFLAQPTGSAPS